MKTRDEQNHTRYMKLYKIDIYSDDIFDIKLNSGKYNPQELLRIVLEAIEVKKSR